jgi:UDP-glucose 4-epimerase
VSLQRHILVTGGAGYIGAHVCVALIDAGYEPVIIDDFSNAYSQVLDGLRSICGRDIECHIIDVADKIAIQHVFKQYPFAAVIHLAAKKMVDESVEEPLMYYEANINGLTSILSVMRKFGVKPFVYSSSATVYAPISSSGFYDEASLLSPRNPYGHTKLMGEQICSDIARTGRLVPAILRYFNPVGAHPSGLIGEYPKGQPSNLMPLLGEVVMGARSHLTIFGDDYPTPDGTAIRDFIHVMDLAEAHVFALKRVLEGNKGLIVNVGTGQGHSVREIVETYQRINNIDFPVLMGGRREVDAANVCADVSAAKVEMGWEAKRSLDDVCRDLHKWIEHIKSLPPSGV